MAALGVKIRVPGCAGGSKSHGYCGRGVPSEDVVEELPRLRVVRRRRRILRRAAAQVDAGTRSSARFAGEHACHLRYLTLQMSAVLHQMAAFLSHDSLHDSQLVKFKVSKLE